MTRARPNKHTQCQARFLKRGHSAFFWLIATGNRLFFGRVSSAHPRFGIKARTLGTFLADCHGQSLVFWASVLGVPAFWHKSEDTRPFFADCHGQSLVFWASVLGAPAFWHQSEDSRTLYTYGAMVRSIISSMTLTSIPPSGLSHVTIRLMPGRNPLCQ